jgi:tRNA(His) guanylyltransferase
MQLKVYPNPYKVVVPTTLFSSPKTSLGWGFPKSIFMKFDELEAHFRALESRNDARLPDAQWIIARLDGRGFTRLTKRSLDLQKPFDARFHEAMRATVAHGCECGFSVRLAYSQSDEISLLFEPLPPLLEGEGRGEGSLRGFDGKTRKWLSVLAGEASAAFSLAMGSLGAFDCRLLALGDDGLVEDYFRWRQADATRNALSAHAYWLLRSRGESARSATKKLDGLSPTQKRAWLEQEGVQVGALPLWQMRGFAAFWENFEKEGFNPTTGQSVRATRKRLRFEVELPDKEEFGIWLNQKIKE